MPDRTGRAVYIAGICGAFMAGLARIAQQSHYKVAGCDKDCYPPMSDQLQNMEIHFDKGFDLPADTNQHFIIGNAMSRGNPLVEAILNDHLDYTSGPQWLYEQILKKRRTLCVAGTHGKTTTTSILAWILSYASIDTGFLIGGTPTNFGVSSHLGDSDFFVIEGDEYDTAFFDKRSKFIHYHPQIAILNNLEFDHADIFADIEAIKNQFHHLVRIIPSNGLLVVRANDNELNDVLERGHWCNVQTFGLADETADWQVQPMSNGEFEIFHQRSKLGVAQWDMLGEHNMLNALSAFAVAFSIGIQPEVILQALTEFKGVSRRLEVSGRYHDIVVYDDFAHHPTEIRASINALKQHTTHRVVAVIEPRSNSMKLGCHNDSLLDALSGADKVFFYEPQDLSWSAKELLSTQAEHITVYKETTAMLQDITAQLQPNDKVLIMSNGGFENVCQRLCEKLSQ